MRLSSTPTATPIGSITEVSSSNSSSADNTLDYYRGRIALLEDKNKLSAHKTLLSYFTELENRQLLAPVSSNASLLNVKLKSQLRTGKRPEALATLLVLEQNSLVSPETFQVLLEDLSLQRSSPALFRASLQLLSQAYVRFGEQGLTLKVLFAALGCASGEADAPEAQQLLQAMLARYPSSSFCQEQQQEELLLRLISRRRLFSLLPSLLKLEEEEVSDPPVVLARLVCQSLLSSSEGEKQILEKVYGTPSDISSSFSSTSLCQLLRSLLVGRGGCWHGLAMAVLRRVPPSRLVSSHEEDQEVSLLDLLVESCVRRSDSSLLVCAVYRLSSCSKPRLLPEAAKHALFLSWISCERDPESVLYIAKCLIQKSRLTLSDVLSVSHCLLWKEERIWALDSALTEEDPSELMRAILAVSLAFLRDFDRAWHLLEEEDGCLGLDPQLSAQVRLFVAGSIERNLGRLLDIAERELSRDPCMSLSTLLVLLPGLFTSISCSSSWSAVSSSASSGGSLLAVRDFLRRLYRYSHWPPVVVIGMREEILRLLDELAGPSLPDTVQEMREDVERWAGTLLPVLFCPSPGTK